MSCYFCKHKKSHFESNFSDQSPVWKGFDLKKNPDGYERVCISCGAIWNVRETSFESTKSDFDHLPPSERYNGTWTEARGSTVPVSLAYLIKINDHAENGTLTSKGAKILVEATGKLDAVKMAEAFLRGKLRPNNEYPNWTPVEHELTHWLENTFSETNDNNRSPAS